MNEPIRAGIYCGRPSSTGSTDDLLEILQRVAASRGWQVIGSYTEQPTRTGSARSDRTGLDAPLAAAASGEIDVVLVTSIDQLGSSLRDVVEAIDQLRGLGIEIVAGDLDTTSPAGPAIWAVFTALAGCERTLRRERAKTGAERARRQGTKLGRPSNMNHAVRSAIVVLHEKGVPIRGIARQLKVGYRAIYAALRAAEVPTGQRERQVAITHLERL